MHGIAYAGKVFIYWLGTEPFLYIADPALLKKLSTEVKSKNWGKPAVFRHDRAPMFGNGLVMSEGDEWLRHRHAATPAFKPTNLKVRNYKIKKGGAAFESPIFQYRLYKFHEKVTN